eukprot:TRINITY_DN17857_c1_g1_i1.p1 TRINITY_DN17857_c1_g1~~TRINITY_DN17857_c1_g1_i1.p1  ORF type:complete len:166 (+),score=29.66 TRINITY_DN17857_c1_g1_i1:85-582(+)
MMRGATRSPHVIAGPRIAVSEKQLAEHRWRTCVEGTNQELWIRLHDLVLAVSTDFLARHPGGQAIVIQSAGGDATSDFEAAGHSERARRWADQYVIGYMVGCAPPAGRAWLPPLGDNGPRRRCRGRCAPLLIAVAAAVGAAVMAWLCFLNNGDGAWILQRLTTAR